MLGFEEEDVEGHPKPLEEEVTNLNFTRNDPALPDIGDLVVFFGPPFAGKTRYFHERLSLTHTRVSSLDLRGESIHRLVKRVTGLLQSGQNVVVDDCNTKPELRQSYLGITKTFPHLRISAVSFWPVGGLRQCLWAREYVLAETGATAGFDSVEEIHKWFAGVKQPPRKHEGYGHILGVRSFLYPSNCAAEFSRPSLIIDAATLVEFVPAQNRGGNVVCECVPKFKDPERSLNEWVRETGGTLVLMVSEPHIFPSSLQMYIEEPITYFELMQSYHDQLLEALALIAPAQCPIQILGLSYSAASSHCWWDLPNPGMVACAQRLHRINLDDSIVVTDEQSPWYQMAEYLGIDSISARLLFQPRGVEGWNAMTRLRRHVKQNSAPHSDWEFTRKLSVGTTQHLDLETDPDLALPEAQCAGFWWEQRHGVAVVIEDEDIESKGPAAKRKLPAWMASNVQGGDEEENVLPTQPSKRRMDDNEEIDRISVQTATFEVANSENDDEW